MAKKHRIHHGLDLALAKLAIGKAMEAYTARFADYDPTFAWDSDTRGSMSFVARGMKVTGDLEILGDEVTVSLEVPFVFRIFRRKAMEVVDREVRLWCEKARRGELE